MTLTLQSIDIASQRIVKTIIFGCFVQWSMAVIHLHIVAEIDKYPQHDQFLKIITLVYDEVLNGDGKQSNDYIAVYMCYYIISGGLFSVIAFIWLVRDADLIDVKFRYLGNAGRYHRQKSKQCMRIN